MKKIFRDLWENRGRTILTIVAMIVGIVGVGAVLCAYSILLRELDANYMVTDPASASLYLDRIDQYLLEEVKHLPDVKEVEARGFYRGRFEIGPDQWKTLWLFVIQDFNQPRLNKLTLNNNTQPPKTGEILLEKLAFGVANAETGDSRYVVIPGHPKIKLHITGSVHDRGEAPAWMENLVYGYITPDTLEMLGETSLNELNIIVADHYFNRDHVKQVAQKIKEVAENMGYQVSHIKVPVPGEHPHATQLASLLFILQVFGFLALALSSIIVINLISAMLAQQIRQIGVMKAIGARTSQIIIMYLGKVLFLGVIALIIGIPLALFFARMYSEFAATMLNFLIMDDSVPIAVFVVIIGIGLLLPVLSALYPIYQGSRNTVKEALSDYGISGGSLKINPLFLVLTKIKGLSRPLLLSIRNTFRKRGRVILTIGTLAVGGSTFIAAFNIGASITRTIEVIGETLPFDIEMSLARPVAQETVQDILTDIEGIRSFEGWGEAWGLRMHPDGPTGEFFPVLAPRKNTNLFKPQIIEGRWLSSKEKNEIVLSHMLVSLEKDLHLGAEMIMRIGNTNVIWKIVGIVQQIGPPVAFVTYDDLADLTGQQGMVKHLRIVATEKDEKAQLVLTQQIEKAFSEAGVVIAKQFNVKEYRKALEDHFLIIVSFLMIMAVLIIIVGGLGLMTTMSIQVIERTREIGVMRAIGASSHAIMQMIQMEGLVIGLVSWFVAIVIALPVSYQVGNIFGNIFFKAPLNFVIAPFSIWIWLGLLVVFSFLAGLFPGIKAVRLSVRDSLAYE